MDLKEAYEVIKKEWHAAERKSKKLEKAFGCAIPPDVYDVMESEISGESDSLGG